MITFLLFLVQCTWGAIQTAAGFFVFIANLTSPHYVYRGAVVTVWKKTSSVSLGLFIFITYKPFFCDRYKHLYTEEELLSRLLVHEYGHAVQSMILGPLYLLIIGAPSACQAMLPYFKNKRKCLNRSYFSYFPENWANRLGEAATGKKSTGALIID